MGKMEKPLTETTSKGNPIWISEPILNEELSNRLNTAFNVALGKLLDTNGNIETVVQTGEAFGRGLFSEFINEKPEEWTIKEWLEATMENIFNPMGNAFTFTRIDDDKASTVLSRCPLHESSNEHNVVGLFTYGFIRGLLRSAFPDGEVLMGSTMAKEAPMTEFIFKTNASNRDRFERERVKDFFMTRKL
jgi:hypothetical protein